MNAKQTSVTRGGGGVGEIWPYRYTSLRLPPSSFGALRDQCSAPVCCSGRTGSSSASCRRTSGGTLPSTDALPHQCCLNETRGENGGGESSEKLQQRSFKCQCYNYIANAEFVMCKATRFGICPWYYRHVSLNEKWLPWAGHSRLACLYLLHLLPYFCPSTLISTPEKTLTKACVSLKFSFFEPQYGGTHGPLR